MDDNETELFRFLAQQVTRITTKKGAGIYAPVEGNVLCSVVNADLTNLVSCSHDEADALLLLHLSDAVKAGYKKYVIAQSMPTWLLWLSLTITISNLMSYGWLLV